MTAEEEDQLFEKIQCRHRHRAAAFYGSDELVSHGNEPKIDPLGFLPTPSNSRSGSLKSTFPDALPVDHPVFRSIPRHLSVAYADTQGRRNEMEDALLACSISDTMDLVALFDGHDGSDAAHFCRDNFPKVLLPLLNDDDQASITHALHQAFIDINEMLKQHRVKGGTTALIVLVTPNTIFFANCGDCRAIISHEVAAKRITIDHKPDNPIERERILSRGGEISKQTTSDGKELHRVGGILSVSRALGDFQLSPFISADPDVFHLSTADLSSDFLILGCDGLWDTIADSEAIRIAVGHLAVNPNDWEGACQRLRDFSYANGSKDNISVIMVHQDPTLDPTKAMKRTKHPKRTTSSIDRRIECSEMAKVKETRSSGRTLGSARSSSRPKSRQPKIRSTSKSSSKSPSPPILEQKSHRDKSSSPPTAIREPHIRTKTSNPKSPSPRTKESHSHSPRTIETETPKETPIQKHTKEKSSTHHIKDKVKKHKDS